VRPGSEHFCCLAVCIQQLFVFYFSYRDVAAVPLEACNYLSTPLTDLQIAVDYMRSDIADSQTSLRDEGLAQSTSAAIVFDANELASIEVEERLTEQDDQVSICIPNCEV
jgi:hypothetical protein